MMRIWWSAPPVSRRLRPTSPAASRGLPQPRSNGARTVRCPMSFAGSVEGGSFETSNQTGSLPGSTGDFHYRATLQYFHPGAAPVTPLNLLPAGVARNEDAYDNVTASTKLGYDLAENFDLGLT